MLPSWCEPKEYVAKPKVRCVLLEMFEIESGNHEAANSLRRLGFDDADMAGIVDIRPPPESDQERIERAIAWSFRKRPLYPEHRYSTAEFPALYTSDTVSTAKLELRRQIERWRPDKPISYVVFEIAFDGEVLDLRPGAVSGELDALDERGAKLLGESIFNAGYAGLVAPSAHCPDGGCCCAIFSRENVRAVRVVERGADLLGE
jgi:RES domain